MGFWTDQKVLVTGGRGFVGRHVVDALAEKDLAEVFVVRSDEYDLTKEDQVRRVFEKVRPDYVVHLAGLVGGILANKERPADFFYQNLLMGTFTLHYAWKTGAKRLVAAAAGCGYPEHAEMPLKESDFWSGFPQTPSAPYSLAKRMLHVQAMAYYRQHGFPAVITLPGNLYGPHDNFHLRDAHVVPALVRKFVEAVDAGAPTVEVWGSGKPTRDFFYAGDFATYLLKALERYDEAVLVNMSSGEEHNIREVVELLREITGFSGEIVWNTAFPDGQVRRQFDMSKARAELDFVARTSLREGLERTVAWFRENREGARLG